MKFSELIDSCVECVRTFNPIIKTIDSHADDFLKDVNIIDLKLFIKFKDPYEKVFIKQVFYGCVRYQEFLKVSTAPPKHLYLLGFQHNPLQALFFEY